MIFLTGMIVAVSLEYCNLHKRVALKACTWCKGSPLRLLIVIMIVGSILSMWMSSTTCAALLIPPVNAVIEVITHVSFRTNLMVSLSDLLRCIIVCTFFQSSKIIETKRISNNIPSPDGEPKVNPESPDDNGEGKKSSVLETATPTSQESKHVVTENDSSKSPKPYPGMIAMFSPDDEATEPKHTSSHVMKHSASKLHYHHDHDVTDPESIRENLQRPSLFSIASDSASEYDPNDPTLKIRSRKAGSEDGRFSMMATPKKAEGDSTPTSSISLQKIRKIHGEEDLLHSHMRTMFYLGIAYASNLGGTAVITGAGPNKVFKEDMRIL